MATTNYTGAQILPYLFGRIDPYTNTARVTLRVPGSGFHGYVTGTELIFNMSSGGANPLRVSVDGGAYSTPTLSAGSMTVFTGLSDTAHLVDTQFVTGYGGTYFTASGAASVTGAAPAISADPDYGPFRVARAGKDVVSSVLWNAGQSYAYSPFIGYNGYFPADSDPAISTAWFGGVGARVRGRADRVYVYTSTNSRWYGLEKDGVRVASVFTSGLTGGRYEWYPVGTGLDDGSEHEWTVVCGANGSSGLQDIDAVMLGGASASISATPPTPRPYIMCMGDSITASVDGGGSGSTGGDGTLSWGYKLARLLGRDAVIAGRAGSLITTGKQQVANDLVAAMSAGAYPTHLAVLYGRNNTGSSYETCLADYTALLQNALAVPQFYGKIVAIKVPAVSNWTNNATVNLAIGDAVAAVNSSRVSVVDGSGWTDITANDGTHWTDAGHTLAAQRLYDSGAFSGTHSAATLLLLGAG